MFQTDALWQEIPGDQVPPPLATQHPTLARFHLIKITESTPIYHLSVIFENKKKGSKKLEQFRFVDLEAAINSIADEETSYVRLMQETAFEFSKKPELRDIRAVYKCVDTVGAELLAFDSDCGCFFADSTSCEPAPPPVQETVIWQRREDRAARADPRDS